MSKLLCLLIPFLALFLAAPAFAQEACDIYVTGYTESSGWISGGRGRLQLIGCQKMAE